MWRWLGRARSFFRPRRGQSMTEYALIVALIAIVAIVVLTTMGDDIVAVFQRIADQLESIVAPAP